MTPAPYDQDADQTPAHGIERPTICAKGCPVEIDNGIIVCRHLRTCPLGATA